MPTAPAAAARSKLGILALSAPGSDTINRRHSFSRFNPGCRVEPINLNAGGMGTLAHDVEATRENITIVRPEWEGMPSTGELAVLLEWLFHNAGSTVSDDTTFTFPTSTFAQKIIKIGWHDTQKYWELDGVACAQWSIQSAAAQAARFSWRGEGISFTNSGSAAGGSVPAGPKLIFRDLAATVDGTAVKCAAMSLTVDHGTRNDRYYFGGTSSGPANLDRIVNVSLTIPWGPHSAMWDAAASDTGVEIVVPFVYGSYALELTMPAVRGPKPDVGANVPDELMLPLSGQAYRTGGSGTELTAVLTIPT